ncbi:MAG: ABC transporter ATP-binding protein, partial [Thermovirga sp.]|nr:ABC transporter ATP-binding protein [Thermovirga sp.]
KRAIQLLNMVDVPSPEQRVDYYPHHFSGGMRQRVIIAIALATAPSLIIADEPTTALDVTVQAQLIKRLYQLVKDQGSAMILISHDLALVSGVADRIAVMYSGRIVEKGTMEDIIGSPLHPYTIGLLDSIPKMYGPRGRLNQIEGLVPNPFNLPKGCAFAPRCKKRRPICEEVFPEARSMGEGREVSCHFPEGSKR